MFGNRTATSLSTLQKTYDETYLTCSTAVYYESQGNEGEAMRCWRQALEQIYDHYANRTLPFNVRSETEIALCESIRQLELQCKERIDLLEALRISRQETSQRNPSEDGQSSSDGQTNRSPPEPRNMATPKQKEQGWIGNGTIPAVTYTELARPDTLERRSTDSKTSFIQKAAVGENGPQSDDVAPPLPSRKPLTSTSLRLSPEKRTSRGSSPERHTMRTTLRSSRIGEKLIKTTLRRPSQKPADGPGASKAAALAWGLLGQRGTADQPSENSQELPRSFSNPPTPSEEPRKSLESLYKTWDSNSRRLTPSRTPNPVKLSDRRASADMTDSRQADAYPLTRPSPISVSAASSALNSLTLKDNHERQSPIRDPVLRQRTAPPQTPQSRRSKECSHAEVGLSEVPRNVPFDLKTSADSVMISRRSASKIFSASKPRATRTPSSKSINTSQMGSRNKDTRPGLASSPPTSDHSSSSSFDTLARPSRLNRSSNRQNEASLIAESLADLSDSSTEGEQTKAANSWNRRKAAVLKRLPFGVDQQAAKQILNEIVVQGDEVHWIDIAGLDIAKNALRETVIYPFLRPDLFMGLREPARGMLLFGPPGTGKTMLARAVATESKSTFFSISASSLTSKYLGESEKLVRALFALAKVLAPSIIFVDEIDSLLSQRSGTGEHEATRRIKTEFLIQWSDLQRAAAGREVMVAEKDNKERGGDANRVLVLAATNLPWAIDEAARRRFVRRQYIPLPEAETRAVQLRTLLQQQKHTLSDADIDTLVGMTEGFSGSDITALAKDAAMGPLRSLGEALLHMTMDEIRPIELSDFVASLTTIRPSVSKAGLKQYEDWAKEFGERGG
ncbi:AAA-domain-containing protein [Parathielavia appendiculata]|uniref:AAA-domain-containing protein n=1 Tax=Parathielavia appendiculata TaxID=2587402 RepID=A0AAN6U0P3_9PEZI|nr:AAA-domain-containing protein [Parathielavia appendiculata]